MVARLVELRVLVEATLDFPEEEVDAVHREDASRRLAAARAALDEVLRKSRQGSLLRSGIHVVLAGRPNVGKSSLLNRLAGEERAIVTAIPGTTRDALREAIQIEGVPLVVVDTAGLRESHDEVERLGVERTHLEVERADLVLEILDASQENSRIEVTAAHVAVYNKIDLKPGFVAPAGAVAVSAKTGQGLDALRKRVLEAAGWTATGESTFLARERHLRALEAARAHLERAAKELGRAELFAEELRLAQVALSGIAGEFTADDLLGEIFARFCIGK